MIDYKKVLERFKKECTACGLCLEGCPIICHTELREAAPEQIMEEVLDLFSRRRVGHLARTRMYTCLYCNTCVPSCPQGLNPALAFALGKGILREMGDPAPPGVALIQQTAEQLIQKTMPAYLEGPERADWLISGLDEKAPPKAGTVLFTSCFGLIQRDALRTAFRILQRIDPSVKALGGVDFCCGELQLMAGQPEAAERQFAKMIDGLNALSPEEVVIFCPTCKMNFDEHRPRVPWLWTFITDYISEHLHELGPLKETRATVTIHDPCHLVRGVEPASGSPREILRAIPGIRVLEMENAGEKTHCCGAYAINGSLQPGLEFRDRRLRQARDAGADILTLYCPGCHLVLGAGDPGRSFQVQSLLTLLGRSLGIGS